MGAFEVDPAYQTMIPEGQSPNPFPDQQSNDPFADPPPAYQPGQAYRPGLPYSSGPTYSPNVSPSFSQGATQ